jgi:methyltransferase (TIGR00027 family)
MKPISNTAFYCCGVRMQDNDNENSVCKDTFAKYFMDDRGLKILSSFNSEKNPNAGNVARHRIIDDFIREELINNPDTTVIMIGAGFDSRAYRLNGGNWIELDEPHIISYKNEKLPISKCNNKLQRIPIDFERESLDEKLKEFSSNQSIIVVIEGVFIYLDEDTINHTLTILHKLFPSHKLICDLMTEKFYNKYSHTLHQKFGDLGAKFRFTSSKPSSIFCNSNYSLLETYSIVGKAIEYGSIKVPGFIFKTFLKTLEHGYSIYVFKSACMDSSSLNYKNA